LEVSVRFVIEIYGAGSDGTEEVIQRRSVDTINPVGARKQAQQLLRAWKKRDTSGARVLNAAGEAVYKLDN